MNNIRPANDDILISLYERALKAIKSVPEVMAEVQRVKNLSPLDATANDFIREYAWVVFVSGFNVGTVRRKIIGLQRAFLDWDCRAISQNRESIRAKALAIVNYPAKIDAILAAADFVNEQGWENLKGTLLLGMTRNRTGFQPSSQYFDYIDKVSRSRRLKFLGTANRRFLAKNLGFDIAKNDRHLSRLATQKGYKAKAEDERAGAEDIQRFVEDIAQLVGERASVVETVLFNACQRSAI